MLGISFPPIPLFPLVFIALIPFVYVIETREKLVEMNRAAYLMGFIFSLITIYWVGAFTEMKDPFLMIAGFFLLLVNPCFFMIPVSLYYFARKNLNRRIALFFFPFFWITYEYLYMITDLKFPWLVLGNSLSYFNLFIQTADVFGSLGVSLLILFINVLLYYSINRYFKLKKVLSLELFIALLLFVLPILYGWVKTSTYKESSKKIKVGLIQPNLDPYEKWRGGNLWNLTKIYLDLSLKAVDRGAELIIWPETALPVYLLIGTYPDVVDSIKNFIKRTNVPLLTGMPDFRLYYDKKAAPKDAKYSAVSNYYFVTYNGIYLFSPNSDSIQKYGKMQLVPFGERTPFVDQIPFLGDLIKWGVGIGGWNVGRDSTLFCVKKKIFSDQNFDSDIKINDDHFTYCFAGLVCYESIFPDFVSSFVNNGSEFISVVTNDSWYGNTSGAYQHKEISILRAIENRRYVVRAANGGISCIITPLGITKSSTKMYEKNFLVGEVSLEKNKTFFTENPKVIHTISNCISLWVIGITLLFWMKKKFKL